MSNSPVDTQLTAGDATERYRTVTTERYRTPHGRFLAAMLWRHGMVWFMVTAITVVTLAGFGAAFDLRLAILALMLLFFVLPVIAMFLYFNHGLRPEAFVCVMPHTVTFMPGHKVRIDITVEERNDADEEFTASETAPAARTVSYEFALRNPGTYYVGRDGITLQLDGRSRGFVPVPYSAFASKEDLQCAVTLLTGDANT